MISIHPMNIRQKDLNLLAILAGIAEEMNLSRASQRLGLSQPALSHALGRLRDQFDDPLFVRSQRGLVPTPRLNALLPEIHALLTSAERLYGPPETLNLSRIERRVVIASTEYFEARALPGLVRHLHTHAPGVRLETQSLSGEFPKRELESGAVDLAIAAYFRTVPAGFRLQIIYSDGFVCVCSRRHPYLKTKRTAADYLAARHLQIDVPAGVISAVDQYFLGKKKRRDIALRLGNFLTPPAILATSDLLLTCPLSLALSYQRVSPLTIAELPFTLPKIETRMIWHEKNHRDPFHSWLRAVLANSELLAGPARKERSR